MINRINNQPSKVLEMYGLGICGTCWIHSGFFWENDRSLKCLFWHPCKLRKWHKTSSMTSYKQFSIWSEQSLYVWDSLWLCSWDQFFLRLCLQWIFSPILDFQKLHFYVVQCPLNIMHRLIFRSGDCMGDTWPWIWHVFAQNGISLKSCFMAACQVC